MFNLIWTNLLCFFCFFLKELERQKHIYTKGCVGQFEKWLQDNLIIVAGIFVGIALLQVGVCLWTTFKQIFLHAHLELNNREL